MNSIKIIVYVNRLNDGNFVIFRLFCCGILAFDLEPMYFNKALNDLLQILE